MSVLSFPTGLSPLAKAVLDQSGEGVLLFDPAGSILYANPRARDSLAASMDLQAARLEEFASRLSSVGGRLVRLHIGQQDLGTAVFLALSERDSTLADRERSAIVATLERNNWKLAETARQLGISRTTLWRRLKAYGLHRDGRTRWARSS